MKKLKKFLVEAKKNTYPNKKAVETKIKGGGKLLKYSNEDFFYQDKFFGFNPFAGEELIIKNEKIIWVMNYFGEAILKTIQKEIYNFLKKILMRVDEKYPFRGPNKFKEGNFSYTNKTIGDIASFYGTEKIYFKEKEVYYCRYHGGFVK